MAIYSLKVALFLWVCLVLPSILAKPVKYCDKKANYAVKVKGVEFNPDPVVAGEKAEFKISASSDKSISGGEVTIDVKYYGVHVHSEKIDLCKETSCPVAAGNFVLSHVQTLPGFTPPGLYTLTMSIANSDDQVLTCIRFNFKIALFGAEANVSEI